jgi:hypothetical protein
MNLPRHHQAARIAMLAGALAAVGSGWGAGIAAAPAAGQVRFDFETGDLQGWKVVEGWFENPVSDRAVFHNAYPEIPQNRYNKQGRFHLSTVERKTGSSNDQMTGVIESPVFVLEDPAISFLVGPHHDHLWGAMAVIDRRRGVDGPAGVIRTWPARAANHVRITPAGADSTATIRSKPGSNTPTPIRSARSISFARA